MSDDRIPCPACGGSGGGPFGPPGSAWDVESYECPRCGAAGVVSLAGALPAATPRPLAKGSDREAPKESIRPANGHGAVGGLAKAASPAPPVKRRAGSDKD